MDPMLYSTRNGNMNENNSAKANKRCRNVSYLTRNNYNVESRIVGCLFNCQACARVQNGITVDGLADRPALNILSNSFSILPRRTSCNRLLRCCLVAAKSIRQLYS